MTSRENRTFPRPTQGRSKAPLKRWTPAAKASPRRRTDSDRPPWKPSARVQALKLSRWTPAKRKPAQTYRDPETRKIARRNHLLEPSTVLYSASPQRPGRGWLYELYASQGRLADYFRLFPNG